jgi:hypothetical protein
MIYSDEGLSYYLHTLACHGGEYMLALGSLGKYMNEGVENHHKFSWQLLMHTFRGGAAGNTHVIKREDGTFEKSAGSHYKHEPIPMTEAVMTQQSRLFFWEFSEMWDQVDNAYPLHVQCNTLCCVTLTSCLQRLPPPCATHLLQRITQPHPKSERLK